MTRSKRHPWQLSSRGGASLIAAAILATALAVASCGDGDDGGGGASVAPASQAELAAPGPFAVGTIADLVFVDDSRATPANGTYPGAAARTLRASVWYPVDAGGSGPSAAGPFPLIGYAHGYTSNRAEGVELKEHLVSHGYVVVAPDFPLSNGGAPGGPTIADLTQQPGDIAFVMQALRDDPTLGAIIDGERQGIAGLSLGGATTVIGAYHPTLNVAAAGAAVAMAPVSCFFGSDFYARNIPTMFISGDADKLIPFDSDPAHAFALAEGPVALVRQIGGTHVGFLGLDVPGAVNSDVIGCRAVEANGTLEDPAAFAAVHAGLQAGLDGELVNDATCAPEFCVNDYVQTMSGERQVELTKIALLAHFEAHLRDRADAAAFIAEVLARDNADLEVTSKP